MERPPTSSLFLDLGTYLTQADHIWQSIKVGFDGQTAECDGP